MNNLKLFQNIFRKNCLSNSQFKQIDINFQKEKTYSINCDTFSNSIEDFNNDISFFKNIYLKSAEVIDTIHNLVISNLKGVNSQSITEKNHFFKEMKGMITDINNKENILRQTLEKYYNHKKLIEKLNNNLENSKINSAKYELIVKIEMQIKIATKQLNEIQTALSLSVDNYKESRTNFSENSLKIYLNFMKNITREYEVLRALLLSFFDFFNEIIESFKHGILNKNNSQILESLTVINNLENRFAGDHLMINAIFDDFLNEYFINVDLIRFQDIKKVNFNLNNDSRRLINSSIRDYSPNGDQIIERLDALKDVVVNEDNRTYNINKPAIEIENENMNLFSKNISKMPFIDYKDDFRDENCFIIENSDVLGIKEDNFPKDLNRLNIHITSVLNKLKDFFETKIDFLKKHSNLLRNYVILSNQIINAFKEYGLQNKKMRKNKIHYFFQMFNQEHLSEFDHNESVNLNLIFIKIFNIANKISEDVSNHTANFNKNINHILNKIGSQDKKNTEMIKLLNEKFTFLILEAEKIQKKFLNEFNSVNKEKINNKNLYDLKLKKIAENFIIRKNLFIGSMKGVFGFYNEIINETEENINSFNQEYSNLKNNLVNSLNKNSFIFINILEKSSKQLSNCYNIEEEIKNIAKLKEKINNEILELILFNKDYKLDIVHDIKCNYHNKLDIQKYSSRDKIDKNSPVKNEINLFNERNLIQNPNISRDDNSLMRENYRMEDEFNSNIAGKQSNLAASAPNLNETSKIKNSYFQKIKNFILKKTSNSRINNLQSSQDNKKILINAKNVKAPTGEIIKDIEDILSNIDTKEKGYENYSISNQGYLKKEEANWFNKLLETFFQRWKENDFFKKWFKKLLYRIYNKKRTPNLDTIWIDDVKFSGSPPVLKVFKEVDFERTSPFEFLYDIDISYKGTTNIFLSTTLLLRIPYINKNVKIPLNIEIVILSLNGIVRLYYNGNQGAESWYAFLGEPVINFDINIVIGEKYKLDINVLKIKNFLKKSFKNKFRKYSLPNKRPLTIPLTIDPSTLGVPDRVGNPKKM